MSDEIYDEYWKFNFKELVAERDEARRWARLMMQNKTKAIENNQSLTRMANKMVLRIAKLSRDLEDALQQVESTREVMKDSEERFSQWFVDFTNKLRVARDERDEANKENAALRAEVERWKYGYTQEKEFEASREEALLAEISRLRAEVERLKAQQPQEDPGS
jgi:hypothetical protein